MDRPPPLHRRDVFKLGALGALAATAGLVPASAIAQDPRQPPPTTARVVVDIPGLPEASRGTFAIEIDPLEIEVDLRGPVSPNAPDTAFRLYGPGHAHWGSASFTSACTLGASKELQTWFNDAVAGKNIRKNITVTLFKSDKSPGRSYNLMDCFPTQWSAVNFDTSSTVQTETLRVKVGRIEFKT